MLRKTSHPPGANIKTDTMQTGSDRRGSALSKHSNAIESPKIPQK